MSAAPFTLLLSRQAEKFLAGLRPAVRERLDQALSEIASEPRGRGCKPLHGGEAGYWRRRVGDWRIVYEIDEGPRALSVHRIDDRKQVYR